MTSFLRIIGFGFKNFWRNSWLSLATVLVLVLSLFSVNVLLAVNVFASGAAQAIQEKVDLTVFFVPESQESLVLEARSFLLQLNQVKKAEYISKEQALEEFKRANAQDPDLAATLQQLDDNPLGPELRIQAKNPADYGYIMESLESPKFSRFISDKNYDSHQDAVENLTAIIRNTRALGYALAVLFGIIGMLIVFNAVRVTMYTHREEIGIMRLVGASDAFIRGPFWVESVIASMLATGITALLVVSAATSMEPAIAQYFGDMQVSLVSFFVQNGWRVFGLQLAVLVVLTIGASTLATRRYLKV